MNDPSRTQRHEMTFVVRMWRNGDSEETPWRGSVHDVASGKRTFVAASSEIAEVIAVHLRDHVRPPRS